jgi:hypothetical protein
MDYVLLKKTVCKVSILCLTMMKAIHYFLFKIYNKLTHTDAIQGAVLFTLFEGRCLPKRDVSLPILGI